MDRDPYELCPCGSGNKLKFCCADVASEMEKLERLLANNQPRMALQGLEKLYETHPDSQWVRTTLASTLINEDRAAEAKKVLAGLLKLHPQQPFANVLYALASYNADGYPESKRAVHRAFKQSTTAFPELVGTLTATIANLLGADDAVMASRQYLVHSLKLTSEELRRDLFEELVELDSEKVIAYPLRSVRHPENLVLGGDAQNAVSLAKRYSAVGCWEEAADELEKLTESHGSNPSLWYNLGLYRAWDADHLRAAKAFRQAARAYDDFNKAVDAEVLAQLLERTDPETGNHLRLRRFNVSSVGQLLSRFDGDDHFARMDDRAGRKTGGQNGDPVAQYLVLNRPVAEDEDFSSWTWESVPLIEGRLTVFDHDNQSDQPAQAFLVGLEGGELERTVDRMLSTAGGLLEPVVEESEDDPDATITGHIPAEELPLRWPAYVPPTVPAEVSRRTAEQQWQHSINEIWPNIPCQALEGRTPAESAGRDDDRVALSAALIVLDAFADARGYLLNLDELRERFKIDPPQPLTVDERTNVNQMTILQILRLQLSDLSAEQFAQVMKRATVVRHGRLLYDVMREALNRPEISEEFEQQNRYYTTLAGVCGNSLRREETLEWISRGRQLAERQPHSFEHVLEWKMREVTLRMDQPEDERLHPLLEDLWQNYGAKLPQLREYLVTMTSAAGVTPPWESSIIAPAAVSASGGGRWWGESKSSAGSEKKLWLPDDSD